MEFKHTLKQTDRIKMYLHDYYFGYSSLVTFLRFFTGPICIIIGALLLAQDFKFAEVYGAVSIFYGVYYMIKPIYSIVLNTRSFKTVSFDLEIDEEGIEIEDLHSKSEISFEEMPYLKKRKFYFVLRFSESKLFYLPLSILTRKQIEYLSAHSS